jgi:hypothetical protein
LEVLNQLVFELDPFLGKRNAVRFPFALVDDGRRHDKMFNAEYFANNITFPRTSFTGCFRALRRQFRENMEGVAPLALARGDLRST